MRKLWASLLWLKATSLSAAPLAQPHGDQIFTYVHAEQLEYRIANNGSDTLAWDVRGWAGGDYHRLWFKTQGDDRIDGPVENGEVQLRYSRLATPFWDLAVGARYGVEPDPSRAYAVFALHGLAPYRYEVDADMFISEEGDVSARLEVEYPLLLTQKLILQPQIHRYASWLSVSRSISRALPTPSTVAYNHSTHQYARVDRGATRTAFHRADIAIQRRETQALDKRPHRARGMLRREGGIEIYWAQLDLVTLRHQHPRRAVAARCGWHSGIGLWEIREQRRFFVHGAKIAYS